MGVSDSVATLYLQLGIAGAHIADTACICRFVIPIHIKG